MLLSHRIEQLLFLEGEMTVARLSRRLGISRERCLEELAPLEWFGVEVTMDGAIRLQTEVETPLHV